MAAASPLITEIDPGLRYNAQVAAGRLISGDAQIRLVFGGVAGDAMQDREVAFIMGAKSKRTGERATATDKARGVTAGVIRMASPEAASAVVSPKLRDRERDADAKTPEKVPLTIPGKPTAVAYTQDFKISTSLPSNIAFLAHKQFVIAVYGDFSPEQIGKYFELQIKGLDGFTPTPVDKFTSLPVDEAGIAQYTLTPPTTDRTRTGSAPARVGIMSQSDMTLARKAFDDAGVDAIGFGGSTVYRAKDASGATGVRDAFLNETKETYAQVTPVEAKGVPNATCLTLAQTASSTTKITWCIAAVGRYLVEVAGQPQQAVQGIGASYLMLRDAK